MSEWSDTATDYEGAQRWVLGGAFENVPHANNFGVRVGFYPEETANWVGFRLVMIPEPGTGLLVLAGLLGLAGRRRARA